jgi:iron-sulfur cluster assembly accessory protein
VIALTPKAAEKIRSLAAEDPDARVLRVAVEGGGCSGFQYAIGFDAAPEPDDVEVESHGVHVVVDRISLPYLQGSTIDYADGLMTAGFSFENPNVASSCGCNSSFQAKPDIEGPYSPKTGTGSCGSGF